MSPDSNDSLGGMCLLCVHTSTPPLRLPGERASEHHPFFWLRLSRCTHKPHLVRPFLCLTLRRCLAVLVTVALSVSLELRTHNSSNFCPLLQDCLGSPETLKFQVNLRTGFCISAKSQWHGFLGIRGSRSKRHSETSSPPRQSSFCRNLPG